jgi:hypothetical protein
MVQKLACREWWIELDYLIMSLPCTVKAQGKVAACMLDSIYIYIYIYIGNGEMGENKTQDPINSHPWMHDINVIVIGVLNALTNCIIIIIVIKQ